MSDAAGKLLMDELSERLDDNDRELFELREFIKELETTNRRLMESERLKSDFLSNLKNEINNPTASLIALSGELMNATDESERAKVSSMIHYESLSLDFQLRNILAAAELEAGESSLRNTRVDIDTLIDDCVASFAPMISEKGIRVKRRGHDGDLCISTDADKLFLVMLNLISNGVVFNKDSGSLDIVSDVIDGTFLLSVTDEGIGIDKAYHDVIFDRFKELYTGSTKKFRGHGLGLSVAKAMAEHLGGSISVDSAPGKGSAFTLRMPALLSKSDNEATVAAGVEYFLEPVAMKEY